MTWNTARLKTRTTGNTAQHVYRHDRSLPHKSMSNDRALNQSIDNVHVSGPSMRKPFPGCGGKVHACIDGRHCAAKVAMSMPQIDR